MNWSIGGMTKIVEKKSEHVTLKESLAKKAEDLDFNGRMANLLINHDESIEDKIAVVKTVQLADSERFSSAFKTLMKG